MELMEETKLLLKVAPEKLKEEKKMLLSTITADSEDVYDIVNQYRRINKLLMAIENVNCNGDLQALYKTTIITSNVMPNSIYDDKDIRIYYAKKLNERLSNNGEVSFVYNGYTCKIVYEDNYNYSCTINSKKPLTPYGDTELTAKFSGEGISVIEHYIRNVDFIIRDLSGGVIPDDADLDYFIYQAKILDDHGSISFSYDNLEFYLNKECNGSFTIEYSLLRSTTYSGEVITFEGHALDAIRSCYEIADHF